MLAEIVQLIGHALLRERGDRVDLHRSAERRN
jgi:hypothetical protein